MVVVESLCLVVVLSFRNIVHKSVESKHVRTRITFRVVRVRVKLQTSSPWSDLCTVSFPKDVTKIR